MHPAVKLACFAVMVVASFGAAFGLGRTVGGSDVPPRPSPAATSTSAATTTTVDHGAHS